MTREMALARWHMLGEDACMSCRHRDKDGPCMVAAGRKCYTWPDIDKCTGEYRPLAAPLTMWEPRGD